MARESFDNLAMDPGTERLAGLPHHEELARIWGGLQVAARTDSDVRQFVEYFSADAARLFGAASPQP